MDALIVVDHTAIRTNQATIIILLVLGYIFNVPLIVLAVSLFMLVGTVLGRPGFAFLYTGILRPPGWVKPDCIPDHPEPHRFAQGFGATVLLAAFVALSTGLVGLGWALSWLVVALAALNLFAGFCAGCAVYYWLNRLRVPGFLKAPPAGTFPGLRPHHAPVHVQEERR